MAYEQLKNRRKAQINDRELSNWDYLSLSAVSKIFAGSVTYPYQVLRTRLQIPDPDFPKPTITSVTLDLWRREGLIGFYRGYVFPSA